MKKHILKALTVALCAGVLMTPNAAWADVTINSLDFVMTNSKNFDCYIFGNVDLERDPSWTDEQFVIRLFEEYMVQDSEEVSSVDEFRNTYYQHIKDSWSSFYSNTFYNYGWSRFEDFGVNYNSYYNQYHDELADEYYRAYMLQALLGDSNDWEIRFNDYGYDVAINYCEEDGSGTGTTYYDQYDGTAYGYGAFFKLNGREINVTKDDTTSFYSDEWGDYTLLSNGYMFHEDGFGELKVELIKTDDVTAKVKYTLTNLTGAATDYGIAFFSDTYINEYDAPTISKTESTITITQDNYTRPETFGTQFNLELDPLPNTIGLGSISSVTSHRWQGSTKNYVNNATNNNNIEDTSLSYSWQGQIGADESKTFYVTFTVNNAEPFENNFYYLEDEYTTPTKIYAFDNGVMSLPDVEESTRAGYHHAWSTTADGSGNKYEAVGIPITADRTHTNYYEVEVPNEIMILPAHGEFGMDEFSIVLDNEKREEFQNLLGSIYSNIFINSSIIEQDPIEFIKLGLESSEVPDSFREQFMGIAGEDHKMGIVLSIDSFWWNAIYRDGSPDEYANASMGNKYTNKIKLTDEFKKGKGDFRVAIVKPIEDEDAEFPITIELVPATYDTNTGEIFFEGDDMAAMYLVYYAETPETPDAPKSGFAKIVTDCATTSFAGSVLFIAIALVLGFYYRKANTSKKA